MHKIVDPKQARLFDPYDNVLTEKTRKRLLDGWAGVFRPPGWQGPLDHTAKERRLAGSRREEATEVFHQRYRVRGGIEGTNSGLKRRTGLGQLRVRGQPRVFSSILLKVAGWNILRAAACAKMRQIVYARANVAVFWLCFTLLIKRIAAQTVRRGPRRNFSVYPRQFTEFQRFYVAA